MSKAKMDKVMKKALKIASDEWARKGLDRASQIVTVTRHNITAAFADAMAISGVSVSMEDKTKVGNAAFVELSASVNRSRLSEKSEPLSDSNKLVFTQKRYTSVPFRNMKKKGKAKLEEILGRELTGSESQAIDLGAQRLHSAKSATVGLARLSKVMQVIDKHKWGTAGDKFTDSQPFKDIFSKYGDIFANIEIKKVKGTEKLIYNGQVQIDVKRKAKNFPGSEDNDWKTLKPVLEKALSTWLGTLDLADLEGSKSIREESVEAARFIALSSIPSRKGIKKPKVTQPKSKPKKGGSFNKATKIKTKSAPLPIKKTRRSSSKQEGASLYQVMALINDKLPEVVQKNMGPPRLENQTGRFAGSVRITDASRTPQGMPSFGYTYRKDPYSVYETTSGSSRADEKRDPRKLIDASIREIAAGYALGRFYTRRV
jgi:hypothetical protein